MTRIIVDPGACGFTCKIEVEKTGKYQAAIRIWSGCKQIKKLAAEIQAVNFLDIVGGRFRQNTVSQLASQCSLHPSCVIPCGIIKAVEVELGMAVTKDVSITFEE
jgi:hypothetical protein